MKQSNRWLVVLLMLMGVFLLTACGGADPYVKIEPASVEPIAGTEYNRVVLTERAVERLGVETDTVQQNGANLVVPYAAVVYGLNGETWVYTTHEPRTYSREPITVDHIDGDMAVLVDGPPVGTEIVTVAVAELFGTDTGVGK